MMTVGTAVLDSIVALDLAMDTYILLLSVFSYVFLLGFDSQISPWYYRVLPGLCLP